MKLFITNKQELDERFPDDANNRYKNSKQIHQKAFNELSVSINSEGKIPLVLMPNYKDFGYVLLDFLNKKDDIYFYTFNGTAS